MSWGEKLSWIERGAENLFLKKFGVIAVVIGIALAILIVHEYKSMVHSTEYTKNIVVLHCDSDSDCAICDGKCRSTYGSACTNMVFSKNCSCVNHTCTNVLNK